MYKSKSKPSLNSSFSSQPKYTKPPLMSKHSSQQFSGECIQVFCRVKPESSPHALIYEQDNKSVTYMDANSDSKPIATTFTFTNLFRETQQDQVIPALCQPILQNQEFGALMFAYGVTNSGKTYTTIGTRDNPGILYYLLKHLQKPLQISAFEVYNEVYYTLNSQRARLEQLSYLPKFEFKNYKPTVITDDDDIDQFLSEAINSRSTDQTHSNNTSSRSHAIFRIETFQGRIIGVVDLAGSERFFEGQNAKDGCLINKSLLTLGRCIKAMNEQKQDSLVNIPFRESKLTKALAEYFTTSFKLYMIVTINPSISTLNETRKVLQYSSIARQIKYLKSPRHMALNKDDEILQKQLQDKIARNMREMNFQSQICYEQYMKHLQLMRQQNQRVMQYKIENMRQSAKNREQEVYNAAFSQYELSQEEKMTLMNKIKNKKIVQLQQNLKDKREKMISLQQKLEKRKKQKQQKKQQKQRQLEDIKENYQNRIQQVKHRIKHMKEKVRILQEKKAEQNKTMEPSPKFGVTQKSQTLTSRLVDICVSPFKKGRSAFQAGVNLLKDIVRKISPYKSPWKKYD